MVPNVIYLAKVDLYFGYFKFIATFFCVYFFGYLFGVESQKEAFFDIMPMIILSVFSYIKLTQAKDFNLSEFSFFILLYSLIYTFWTLQLGSQFDRLEMGELLGFSPIFISRLGALLFLLSFYCLNRKSFKFLGFVISIYLLQYGASRGPVLFMFLIFLFQLIRQEKAHKVLFIASIGSLGLYVFFQGFDESLLLERFRDLFQSGLQSTTRYSRVVIFFKSWDSFLPFGLGSLGWGRLIWDRLDTSYSHNLFIDLIIEFGLFGLFLSLNIISKIKNRIKSSPHSLFIVFTILYTLTSGSFMTNVEFWIVLSVLYTNNKYVISR